MKVSLSHPWASVYHTHGVFNDVKTWNEAITAIHLFEKSKEKVTSDPRGMGCEILVEAFFKVFGEETHLGVFEFDPAQAKFNRGWDARVFDKDGNPGQIQVKDKSNPSFQFKEDDLHSFTNEAYKQARRDEVPWIKRILCVPTLPTRDVFHWSWRDATEEVNQVYCKADFEFFTDKKPEFWDILRDALKCAAQSQTAFVPPPPPRPPQVKIDRACNLALLSHEARSRVVASMWYWKDALRVSVVAQRFPRA